MTDRDEWNFLWLIERIDQAAYRNGWDRDSEIARRLNISFQTEEIMEAARK